MMSQIVPMPQRTILVGMGAKLPTKTKLGSQGIIKVSNRVVGIRINPRTRTKAVTVGRTRIRTKAVMGDLMELRIRIRTRARLSRRKRKTRR